MFPPAHQMYLVKVALLAEEGWDFAEHGLQIWTYTEFARSQMRFWMSHCAFFFSFPDVVLSMPSTKMLIRYPKPINLKGTKLAIGLQCSETQSGGEKSIKRKS